MAMDTELLVERTFRKIVLPTRIKRIGFRPDFHIPPDFGFNQMGFPSGVRFPVSAANTQLRPPMEWKYRFFTHRQDFPGCLRLAHCQSLRQTSKSTRANVSVTTICRW
jgi:hypothetical protein